jgi:23S rRNA (adenine2503-C2)-methyltransferase
MIERGARPDMRHFFDLNPKTLAEFCSEQQFPTYLAAQLMDWVYAKGVIDLERMSNVSVENRRRLSQTLRFDRGIVRHSQAATDGTQKLLLGWMDLAPAHSLPVLTTTDERQTECVLIPTDARKTACVSSQVGCPVGCVFCASGIGGLEGNLTAGQIVEQVHRLGRLPRVGRVTNVVFMGMGEPLANFAAVVDAIRTINAPWGLKISARKITVSTVGLPAAIRKLARFELPVTLALSLHAPNDEIRRSLIPWASYTTIAELIDSCDEYFRTSGREITLEYILIAEVNDRAEHARELAHVAGRIRANVNLIRYNEVRGLPFNRPRTEAVRSFQQILRAQGVNVHIRASRGRDIAAACGQLRHEHRGAQRQPQTGCTG